MRTLAKVAERKLIDSGALFFVLGLTIWATDAQGPVPAIHLALGFVCERSWHEAPSPNVPRHR